MLLAYFDETGTHGCDFTAIAGLVGSRAQWDQLVHAWTERLLQDRVDSFHYTKAQGFRGDFYGWSREKRDTLLHDLAQIIDQAGLFALTFSVDVSWKDIAPDGHYWRTRFPSSYHFCFEMALNRLADISRLHWGSQEFELTFDQHEQYGARALDVWRWHRERGALTHVAEVRHARSAVTPELQAADMMAYECFKYAGEKSAGRLDAWRDWQLSNLLVPQGRIEGDHFERGRVEEMRDANPPPA